VRGVTPPPLLICLTRKLEAIEIACFALYSVGLSDYG